MADDAERDAAQIVMFPLFARSAPDQPIAWHKQQAVSPARFLHQTRQLAERLPERPFVFNLCADRYHFLLTFCAALLRGQTNLLPPNHATESLTRLHERFPLAYGISDKGLTLEGMEMISFPELSDFSLADFSLADSSPDAFDASTNIPVINAGHVAAMAFTSGSTGEPQPHAKTWGALVKQARSQAQGLGIRAGLHFLGTVPPQHMYGLESTLMLPLHSGGTIHAGQPLFPADIRDALAELPAPRVLITTPLHLRICLEEQIVPAPVAMIVSAAAPLTLQLAQAAENAFDAPLMEVYGCTETGAIATRRTAQGELWQTLGGVKVSSCDGLASAEGGHVSEAMCLQDVIEPVGDGSGFRLLGRQADLVNIAGKRASLGDLNRQLGQIAGVQDGVFFIPDDIPGKASRLIALVIAPGLHENDIIAALRQKIDTAFLPRPLYKVDELPRTSTGKLPRSLLMSLIAELQHA